MESGIPTLDRTISNKRDNKEFPLVSTEDTTTETPRAQAMAMRAGGRKTAKKAAAKTAGRNTAAKAKAKAPAKKKAVAKKATAKK